MFDLKLLNGKLIDFDTEKEKVCDVGIKDGRIIAIGNNIGPAREEIDVEGKIISPGFIDLHMHEEVLGQSDDGDDYDIANKMLLMGVTTCVAGNCGNNRQDVKDFFDFIDAKGSPVNYLSFIGHNYLRDKVGIEDRYREATNIEIEQMGKLLKEDIVYNGAIGLSFGLEYSPGITFEETIKLIDTVADEDIILSAHYRKDVDEGISSIEEMINMSRVSNKPMQISHIGSCTAFGMMKESLEVIQKAIKEGLSIAADCYPYDAFSTFIGSAVFDEGCFERWNKSYNIVLLTEEPYRGIRCDRELFYKVRKEYPQMLAVVFAMDEREVIEAYKAPFMSVASDGLLRRGKGHPRAAGTFPRVLGRFARDQRQLSFLDALKKMTMVPAKRLGLDNKGIIKEGKDADIVIFDPEKIIDKATFEEPTLPPEGIDYVIINGKIAVKNNQAVENRLGRAIRKKELTGWRN